MLTPTAAVELVHSLMVRAKDDEAFVNYVTQGEETSWMRDGVTVTEPAPFDAVRVVTGNAEHATLLRISETVEQQTTAVRCFLRDTGGNLLAFDFPVGSAVRLTQDVERYPNFIAEAGRTGIVTYHDDHTFCVRMDRHLPGSEEWDNEVWWSIGDDPQEDLKLLGPMTTTAQQAEAIEYVAGEFGSCAIERSDTQGAVRVIGLMGDVAVVTMDVREDGTDPITGEMIVGADLIALQQVQAATGLNA